MAETNLEKPVKNKLPFKEHLTLEGSLGILAYGDLAIVEWKKLVAASKKIKEAR